MQQYSSFGDERESRILRELSEHGYGGADHVRGKVCNSMQYSK